MGLHWQPAEKGQIKAARLSFLLVKPESKRRCQCADDRIPRVSILAFIDADTRVPANHPLRTIKWVAIKVYGRCRRSSTACTRRLAWPSIPPEQLLRALAGPRPVLRAQRTGVL